MQNWAVIASEIINVLAAVIFIVFFSIYLYRIQRLSETQRFLHLYPYRRCLFVLVYVVINIIEIVVFALRPISDDGLFNEIELYFLVGTCLNSAILLYELYILYVEIKREKPFNIIHRIYWLYLTCISLMRLVLEAYYEKGIDVSVAELVLSSFLFADALILFGYSWFMKRYEIQEFENLAQLQFNMLNEYTRSQGTKSRNFQQEKGVGTGAGVNNSEAFPYLNVELRLHNDTEVMIKTYSNSVQVSDEMRNIDELVAFYEQTSKFKLKTRLKISGNQINIVQLQEFFSELLSNWQCYQSFVLQFLNVDEQTQKQINRCRSKQSGHSHIPSFDPSRIYFDIRIPNIAKIVDHYEFDVIVWTNDHEYKRTVHKRYSEFEELDKRLRSFEFKGLKLKTPELPEKFYFYQSEEDKLEDRRSKLQTYIKRILNDRVFVKTHMETRVLLFDFFRLDCEEFALLKEISPPHPFSQFSYEKSVLCKEVTDKGEPVTFYYFHVDRNGERIGVLRKRFKMFDQFNQEFKRWMHNTQTEYKSVKLPTKIPHSSYSQKLKRHYELAEYLNNLVKVQNLEQLYEAKKFLFSYEELPKLQNKEAADLEELRKSSGNSLLQSSRMSRMSQLIDNLQFDSTNL